MSSSSFDSSSSTTTSSTGDSSTTTTIYAVLGFGGSLLLACSQLPQIYRVHKRRLTYDLSYGYQLMYTTATTMFLIYYGYYDIWSIFIPCAASLFCIGYLFCMKVYLEEYLPRKAVANELMGSRLGSALLPETHVKSHEGGGELVS